jgi:hypothetical protein
LSLGLSLGLGIEFGFEFGFAYWVWVWFGFGFGFWLKFFISFHIELTYKSSNLEFQRSQTLVNIPVIASETVTDALLLPYSFFLYTQGHTYLRNWRLLLNTDQSVEYWTEGEFAHQALRPTSGATWLHSSSLFPVQKGKSKGEKWCFFSFAIYALVCKHSDQIWTRVFFCRCIVTQKEKIIFFLIVDIINKRVDRWQHSAGMWRWDDTPTKTNFFSLHFICVSSVIDSLLLPLNRVFTVFRIHARMPSQKCPWN